jgi:predicted DsbA family dithiol-disulfide isomerase
MRAGALQIPCKPARPCQCRWRGRRDGGRPDRTNFAEGRSIFDIDALTAVAVEVGLETSETVEMLASDAYADRVREDERLAAGLGIQGVPFFVLDRRYGISGAQPTEALVDILDRVWLERTSADDARADA